jgi:hypothetical protein
LRFAHVSCGSCKVMSYVYPLLLLLLLLLLPM